MISTSCVRSIARLLWLTTPFLFADRARADGEPVAIIEEVGTDVTVVHTMDLLAEGDSFQLATGQRVIIGYFATCTRDIVSGGLITIAKSGSIVNDGEVHSFKMKCAASTMDLTPEQQAQSAAMTYRDPNSDDRLQPQTVLNCEIASNCDPTIRRR